MDTEGLSVLTTAAGAGSLAAAARRLGLTPIAAARRLAALEAELGVRLMHRTTRALSLTPEGEAFLPYAQSILDSEAAARAVLNPGLAGASGLLRVTAPAALGRCVIIPMLPALFAAHPRLRLELDLTDRIADLVGEGFDVAIRIADLRESNLIVRRVGTLQRVLCASPDYLHRRGRPISCADLAGHDCLTLAGVTHWAFAEAGGQRRVRVGGRMACSTVDGLRAACVQGLGLSMHANWDVADDIAAGRLEAVALDLAPYTPPISALYPSARTAPPKLAVFLQALAAALGTTSPAPSPRPGPGGRSG